MNTHPMTPTPDSWHEMSEPKTFPVLVQYSDGECLIIRDAFAAQAYALRTAIRWRPWVNPELPKPDADAFESWFEEMKTNGGCVGWRSSFYAGAAQATAAERSRFAEGVEKICRMYIDGDSPHGWATMHTSLRALAKGE